MTEQEKIKKLEDQGLTVELRNSAAIKFNEKYSVYQNLPPLGKRSVIVNENGDIIARQG